MKDIIFNFVDLQVKFHKQSGELWEKLIPTVASIEINKSGQKDSAFKSNNHNNGMADNNMDIRNLDKCNTGICF
jgi:hypothetical protein